MERMYRDWLFLDPYDTNHGMQQGILGVCMELLARYAF